MNSGSSEHDNDNVKKEYDSQNATSLIAVTTNNVSSENQKPRVSFNIPTTVWLAIIAAIPVIYGSYLSYLQGKMQIEFPLLATQTVAAMQTSNPIPNSNIQTAVPSTNDPLLTTNMNNVIVSFTNPSNWAVVHLSLIQNGVAFDSFDISPVGAETRILPPGRYQIEARALYPKMTPSSANCYIQWQESTSYTGNLIINVNTAVVQVKQFYLEPQEICFTETLAAPIATPTQ